MFACPVQFSSVQFYSHKTKMSPGPTGPLRSSNKNTGDTFERDQEDQEDQKNQEDQEDQEDQSGEEYHAAIRIASFIERRISIGCRR
jgi:hypothetical protein